MLDSGRGIRYHVTLDADGGELVNCWWHVATTSKYGAPGPIGRDKSACFPRYRMLEIIHAFNAQFYALYDAPH